MTYINRLSVDYRDGPNTDSMSRLRTGIDRTLWAVQHAYDLNPLRMEAQASGSGAIITYGSDGHATLAFGSTPSGGAVSLQSYDYISYTPGRSQTLTMSLFMNGAADVVKFAGYSDGTNGVQFENAGTAPQFTRYSTASGDQTVTQASWNVDPLDGTGGSGVSLDLLHLLVLVIDIQHNGRIRCGFNVDGRIVWAHYFQTVATLSDESLRSAALPVRVGMTCSATVTTTLELMSAAVTTDGYDDLPAGYAFSQEGTVTASSGAQTHLLSLRPRATFNSVTNRARFVMEHLELLVTGSNPVLWELAIGQAITDITTFSDVNDAYSAMEYNTEGTISGSPALVLASGYAAASSVAQRAFPVDLLSYYPITLDASGAPRALGTLSLLVTGIGAPSDCRAALAWREIR